LAGLTSNGYFASSRQRASHESNIIRTLGTRALSLRFFRTVRSLAVALWAAACFAATAPMAVELRVEDVASIADVPPAKLKPNTIAFSDHRNHPIIDAKSGLIRFVEWAKANPLQRRLLTLYPSYDEPTITVTVSGVTWTMKRRLHMYVAEARFELARAPTAIDLTRYVNLAFLERMDPAIKHQLISADDVTLNKDGRLANKHPARRWCEDAVTVICIKSRYQLEGKLPTAILLLNMLRESDEQIADFIEFESELRIIAPAAADEAALAQLTGIDSPVTAALEQNIVHVNQVMQFGKLLAVLQEKLADPGYTVVTAFLALAVESDLVEKRNEFGSVPVLRNMVPAAILAGNTSFNTGNSISAGLPKYARNRIKAMAAILSRE
jgi:hypothetical protein